MTAPLAGITVVEAATYITGPLAARTLADFGAHVVKVEPPSGDAFRRVGRRVNGVGVMWAEANHGKELVTLDLKDPAGVAQLDALLERADVLITNWRTGVAESLGLVPERVLAAFPSLIWCRISGYGPDGPSAHEPAFDGVIQARSGTMFAQGAPGPPQAIRSMLADKLTGTMAAQAVLAALHQRATTGQGAILDMSMLDAVSYFNSFDVLAEQALPEIAGESYNPQLNSIRPVETADGWILLSPARGHQLVALAALLGHPEWSDELRAISDPLQVTERLYQLVATATPQWTTAELLAMLADNDIAGGAVLDLEQHLVDPQIVHNGTYEIVDDPQVGHMRKARYPARWHS